MITLSVSIVYLLIFIFASYSSQQKNWTAGSIFLLLGFMIIGRETLHISSLTYLFNYSYFFITFSSFFFFLTDWKWQPELKKFYAAKSSNFLTAWAISAFLQHLSFLITYAIILQKYPDGWSRFLHWSALQSYFLQPIWWITVHIVLIALLLLIAEKKTVDNKRKIFISVADMSAVFLASLLALMLYFANDVRRFFMSWQ